LRGILVHENRDKKRPVTMMAERGALVRSADGPRFVLFNGNRQEVDVGEVGLSLLNFERYAIDLSAYEASGGPRWREPGERFIHELFNPGTGLDDVNNAQRMRAEAHRRLTNPLYALVNTLIALGAVLAGEFNRRGRWRRIVGAVVLATAVQILALGLPSLAAIRASFVPAMYVGVLAVLGAATYGAFGPRRDPRRPIPRTA
jgi:lipopolysaccharide export system permease protein